MHVTVLEAAKENEVVLGGGEGQLDGKAQTGEEG